MARSRDEAAGSGGRPADLTAIDFSSPAYNRIDELQDCAGNYRSFETLEGIVTADMRHRFERERRGRRGSGGEPAGASAVAVADAIGDREQGPAPPAPVTIVSRGRVLVLDTDAVRAGALARVLGRHGLTCTEIVTGEGRSVKVRGGFGGFSAAREPAVDAGRPVVEPGPVPTAAFDCVLDLQPAPSYAGPLLPPGYYAPGGDAGRLAQALAELPEMRGRFEKPQFTLFLAERCLRGRGREAACDRCAGICPFGAIAAADRGVAVDHTLCEGCGACALVCPADAMRMVVPSSAGTIARLRGALERAARDGVAPKLTICEADAAGPAPGAALAPDAGTAPGAPRVVFALEQIGLVRLETLLAAVRHGARSVAVVCPGTAPAIAAAVRRQVELASAIVGGLGLRPDTVTFAIAPECPPAGQVAGTAAAPETSEMSGAEAPDAPDARDPWPPQDSASLVRAAAHVLHERSGARDPALPLPEGAPFGTLGIAAERCTLCMACAAACPAGALAGSGDAPRLEFREARCHQCGLCAQVCPEQALHLQPRLLCDPEGAARPVVLHEQEAARCVSCGAPFASRAMVDRMTARLKGHWMFVEERQLRRLRQCGTCRARDVLLSEDAARWAR
ncbi:MAG TPA: 4Fe-4S binding protein [bacterium]